MDAGEAKRLIVHKLEEIGAAFVDVGMGLELDDGSLGGILRVTASTPDRRDHVHQGRIPFAGGGKDDIYASNIQVADLNALNAVLAVVKWKKIRRFLPRSGTGASLYVHHRRQRVGQCGVGLMRVRRLEHRFCTHIPESLEPGVLYVSMEYATAAHSCCCGCGEEVVTPFTPTDWKMTFNGQSDLALAIGRKLDVAVSVSLRC